MNINEPKPEEILQSLLIKPVSESIRDKARHRALVAFRNAPIAEKQLGRIPWWVLPLASIATLVLAALVMIPRNDTRSGSSGMFSEIKTMFSGRLLAAIKDGNSLDLTLADAPELLPQDQCILMTLRKRSHVVEVLTYSGQPVRLQLDGHPMELTPLVSGDGSVMIVTDNRLLKGRNNSGFNGFTITAKTVEGARS